ncbi:DNA mismatch repair protein MLH1 [Spathaspora sp. JA1]|nr:DNA mismatch repair protein MLH1 [Spathaspora sp. JA1]
MDQPRIQKLDSSVINKIAAGEIIIQPANALKEMLENSIDAKSTQIDILVKEGGLKLLQITDNGTGIQLEDLPLLCERFATSKLVKFDDLSTINTYGFRGEALASISHISRLSVITKTQESNVAYKAYYLNGKLCSSNFKPESSGQPKPIAGKVGTQIIVEDLFYNIPSRLRGLKSKSDEYGKILDIIGRYAIHCGQTGFSCKKYGDPIQQLNTRANISLQERIRIVYGSAIANELLEVDVADTNLGLVRCSGVITSCNYTNNKKKIAPIIFINHRLVTCDPLKRAINSIFQFFLPKDSHPFFYISLEINSENLDVNIHPTKREVRFLNEDEIIELIVNKIHAVLSQVDSSRKFKTQTIITKRSNEENDNEPIKKYRQENKLNRIDGTQTKLTAYISQENTSTQISNTTATQTNRQRVQVNLDSISQLKSELTNNLHKPLTNIFNHAVYIGIIDPVKRLCCFQYDVTLYLCDYGALVLEFYYQLGLDNFCNFGEIKFDEPIKLQDILQPLYEIQSDLQPMEQVINTIISMKEMFNEYFQIVIDDECQLLSIPMIIQGVQPDYNKLPYFLYRLGTKIDYEIEKTCLQLITRQIAMLYLPEPNDDENYRQNLEVQLETVLFPEIKRLFLPPRGLLRDVIQIADLPGLYKVFERC